MVDINFFTILAAIINFLILYIIIRKFFWQKLIDMIDGRERNIKEAYDTAMERQSKANALVKEKEELLAKSKEMGREIVEEHKQRAEVVSKDIIDSAHDEAKAILDRAQKEAKREKEKLVDELRTETVDLAVSMSSRALESSVNENEHRRLIESFLSKVGN